MTLDDVMGFLSLISDDIKENNQEHRGTGVVAVVYGDNLVRVKHYKFATGARNYISVVYNYRFESKESHYIPVHNENQLLHLVMGLLDIKELPHEKGDKSNV